MAKNEQKINPDTLQVEQEEPNRFKEWLMQSGFYILEGLLLGVFLTYVFFSFFPSPNEKQLRSEKENLEAQFKVLKQKQDQMQLVLNDLQQRDDNLYRVIFGAEPLPLEKRMGVERSLTYYNEIAEMSNFGLSKEVAAKTAKLETEIYAQAKSYDEILEMAKNQELRMENIPAIQPVLNQDLKRVASGYGVRIDPVYHTKKFHHGMDFTSPVGTDVYATGNGKVIFSGWKQGYGNTIVIDHGFGYTTLYAHLYKSVVRKGQSVKRSDIIGLVGNSGKSTGPHLHYEVRINDRPVDPRNYYFYDLSPEEYDLMVQLSNNQGIMLD